MAESETPIEEWRTAKNGRQFVTVKGPGGGTLFRQGDETIDAARLRHAAAQEAKRREQAKPGQAERPKGKGRKQDKPPDVKAGEKVKPAKQRPSAGQLAAAAELPLQVAGAFVGHAMLNCQFCAESMRQNAGAAAADLAKTTNPYLLNLLTWWHGMMAAFAGGDGLTKYFGPPIIHHALPEPMFSFVAPFAGIPPKVARAPHTHGPTQGPPAPNMAAPPPPPGPTPPGGGTPITPAQAAAMAADPALAGAVRAGDPRALAYLQTLDAPNAPAPAREAAERAELEAERARLQAVQAMAARQANAAQEAGNGAGPRVPSYRAPDSLNPTQARQVQAAQEAANAAGSIPNYSHGDNAPGTPTPPGADPAASAGSPLPPEA